MKIQLKYIIFSIAFATSFVFHAAEQVCWKSYRTTLANDAGLPVEVTIEDTSASNNITNLSIARNTNEFFDLAYKFSIRQITAKTINNQGLPVTTTFDMTKIGPATRTIKIDMKDNKLLLSNLLTKSEKERNIQPSLATSEAGADEGQEPKKPGERTQNEYEILIKNKSDLPSASIVLDTAGKEHPISIAAGKSRALYLPKPACFKAISVDGLVRSTGDRIRVNLSASLPCQDQVIEINDRVENDQKELVVTLVRPKGEPSIVSSSQVASQIKEQKPEVAGNYNVTIDNKSVFKIIVQLKYTVDGKKAEFTPTLKSKGSQTFQLGCITEIAVATIYKESPLAILRYSTPLPCSDYYIKLEDQDAKSRIALFVGRDATKTTRVATSPSMKELKTLATEMQAGAAAQLATSEITKNLYIFNVRNEAPFDLSVYLTDAEGKRIPLDLKKNKPQTPNVGCITKIEASGINKRAQEIKVIYDGKLVCTDHKVLFKGDQNKLKIEVDGRLIAESLAVTKKDVVAEPGKVYSLFIKNETGFPVDVTLKDSQDKTPTGLKTPQSLAKGQRIDFSSECVNSIVVSGINKRGEKLDLQATNFGCTQNKIIIDSLNDQRQLQIRVDEKKVATTSVAVKNKLQLINNSTISSAITITETDETKHEKQLSPKRSETIPTACVKKIEVQSIDKEPKIVVNYLSLLDCNKDHKLVIKDSDNATRLNLEVDEKPVASSSRVQTKITVKNSAPFFVTVKLNDLAPFDLKEGQRNEIITGCFKKIIAEGTNKFGLKLQVQTSQPLSCEKDYTFEINSKMEQKQLGIWISGVRDPILSIPLTQAQIDQAKKQPVAAAPRSLTIQNNAPFQVSTTVVHTLNKVSKTETPTIPGKGIFSFKSDCPLTSIKVVASVTINNIKYSIETTATGSWCPKEKIIFDSIDGKQLAIKIDNVGEIKRSGSLIPTTTTATPAVPLTVKSDSKYPVTITIVGDGKTLLNTTLNPKSTYSSKVNAACVTSITATATVSKGGKTYTQTATASSTTTPPLLCPKKEIKINDDAGQTVLVIVVDDGKNNQKFRSPGIK